MVIRRFTCRENLIAKGLTSEGVQGNHMMGSDVQPASHLNVKLEHDRQMIRFIYQIDDVFSGELALLSSFDLGIISPSMLSLLAACGSIFLAQLCLASHIQIDTPSSLDIVSTLEPTIETLYAVRSYRDRVTPLIKPAFSITTPSHIYHPETIKPNKRAVLLWSGGLDSTLSHILLTHNQFKVLPLHVSYGNVDAAESELGAVKKLSTLLDSTFASVTLKFDQYLDIANFYSSNARGFPIINSVPHGREMLLFPLALIYAQKMEASNICFGFENSTWKEEFEFNGRKYSRFDTQSEFCNINIQLLIHKFISSNVSLFSPISPMTEYRKFRTIAVQFPELTAAASFCYWGQSCGICKKCVLYYLFQRSLGLEKIHFKHNPIREHSQFIHQYKDNWNDPNFRENNYALAQLIERQDIREGEDLLLDYQEHTYPLVKPFLQEWYQELMLAHSVALLPKDFILI